MIPNLEQLLGISPSKQLDEHEWPIC